MIEKTKQSGSLILVGSGIKFHCHLTQEAKMYIEQADSVLYLVNEPLMQQWIEKYARSAQSLDEVYHAFTKRIDAYHAITRVILDEIAKNLHVCVVLYGHPCVFSKPGLDAARIAKSKGYATQILPGISAADCLFADLMIDPGNVGCQLYEASDFLFNDKKIDARAHLLLWQIDAIGVIDQSSLTCGAKVLQDLTAMLLKYYPAHHAAVLYEAAQYPHFDPIVEHILLQQLPYQRLSRLTTLYLSPLVS
jgi:uncharacterized protein YabN with tetrapyrrole methylase and pyrophosphatase domain